MSEEGIVALALGVPALVLGGVALWYQSKSTGIWVSVTAKTHPFLSAGIDVSFRNRGAEITIRSIAIVVNGHDYWTAVEPYVRGLPMRLTARYGTGTAHVDATIDLDAAERRQARAGIKLMLKDGTVVDTNEQIEIWLNRDPDWSRWTEAC